MLIHRAVDSATHATFKQAVPEMLGQKDPSELEASVGSIGSSLNQARLQGGICLKKNSNNQFVNKVGFGVYNDKIAPECGILPRKEKSLCVSLPSVSGCSRVNSREKLEDAGWLHSSPEFPDFLRMHESSACP